VASALLALGCQPGDRVAIFARNVPEWPIVQLATAAIGSTLVTVNPSLTDDELEYILSNSGASVLVASPRSATQAALVDRFARGGAPYELRHVVITPGSVAAAGPDGGSAQALSWDRFLTAGAAVPGATVEQAAARAHPDDVVNLLYTSGTTGFPKGVMLTHRGMLQNAAAVGGNLRLGPDERICLAVPFHHCFGSVMGTLAAITFGATLVVPDEWFDAGAVLRPSPPACTVLYESHDALAEPSTCDLPTTDLRSLRAASSPGRRSRSSSPSAHLASCTCPSWRSPTG
jgi:fatty-acyl-CoA synthase